MENKFCSQVLQQLAHDLSSQKYNRQVGGGARSVVVCFWSPNPSGLTIIWSHYSQASSYYRNMTVAFLTIPLFSTPKGALLHDEPLYDGFLFSLLFPHYSKQIPLVFDSLSVHQGNSTKTTHFSPQLYYVREEFKNK